MLLRGETGTGKELVAHAIHINSRARVASRSCASTARRWRRACSSRELFGHEKGAFTGAVARRPGRFELADGGTLFLDEVGDLPLDVQVKLLRVLQEREFERVGGSETIKVDVRVVSATHRNLEQLIADGKFREDLYYRLNVFPITLPPLRERLDDLPRAGRALRRQVRRATGKRGARPRRRGARGAAAQYHLAGQRARAGERHRARDHRGARARRLGAPISTSAAAAAAPTRRCRRRPRARPVPALPGGGGAAAAASALHEQERNEIVAAIDASQGNIAHAARALGINRSTLYYRLRKHGLEHLLPTKPQGEGA